MEEAAIFCYKVILAQIDGFYVTGLQKERFLGEIL
jgi:hypothetical protein